MSSELEQQLQRALARVEPDETATEQAKAAALAALSTPGLRSRYRLALVAAALVVALVVTGVTLAASRTAREVVGIADGPAKPHGAIPRGPLPPGSGGFAAYGNGRLWLASPSLTIAGTPYSAVELSPGALNIAVGSGHDLVVRRLSDGGVAWSHHTAGRVVAAAWAPIGTEIAYVVESREGAQLRMIEGDGDHDHLIARSVSAVTPSWRADSLALAYVSAEGQVAVRDLASKNSTHIRPARGCPLVEASQVAFAPRGTLLAASIGNGGMLVADPERGWVACAAPIETIGPQPPALLAWTSGREMVVTTYQFVARLEVRGHRIRKFTEVTAPSGIIGLTVSPDRRQIAIGLARGGYGPLVDLQLVVAEMPGTGDTTLRIVRTLRRVPMSAAYSLIWR
jgi:hypothetical protein